MTVDAAVGKAPPPDRAAVAVAVAVAAAGVGAVTVVWRVAARAGAPGSGDWAAMRGGSSGRAG
ncbi:hypothetical protein [Mycolicibacterium vanbaalenii]|uniref:hypothetical protein n=1 Tax=Mycolicibacterium vanbaalenii TaxID=110539 RepID=UPI0023BAC849|nr:hypothetical protein [Mycolicibacterium vanbaalenii]